jgi:hypothetical protein
VPTMVIVEVCWPVEERFDVEAAFLESGLPIIAGRTFSGLGLCLVPSVAVPAGDRLRQLC